MQKNSITSSNALELRRLAEETLQEKTALSKENLGELPPEEVQRVLHELRVHQIELEMQNEELRRTQAELDEVRAHYFDLYDLAPVGYCTISEHGLILQVNLTTATLLGVTRGSLIKKRISQFILKEDQDIFYRLQRQVTKTSEPQKCELRMVKNDGTQFWALLESTATLEEGYENRENRDAGDRRENSRTVIRVVIVDISERKRTEQALLESEYKYRNLFNTMSEGFALNEMIFDEKGEMIDYRILEVNPAFYTIADYDGPVVGNVATKLYGLSVGVINAFWREHKSKNTAQLVEMRGPTTDRTFIISTSPFLNDQFVTLFFDITELKRAEEKLNEVRLFLNSVIEHSPTALWISDEHGTLMRMNQACRDVLQLRDEEVVGKYNILRDNQIKVQGYMPQVLKVFEKGEIARFRMTYNTADVKGLSFENTVKVVLDVNISAIRDAHGKVTNAIVQHINITQLDMVKKELRESEERYRLLATTIPEPLFLQQDGRFIFANNATLKLFGAAKMEDLIGTPVIERIHPQYRQIVMDQIGGPDDKEEAIAMIEEIFLRLDGSPVNVEVAGNRLIMNGKATMQVVAHDITERKKMLDSLRESEQRYYRSEASLREAQSIAQVGSWTWDLKTQEVIWSDEMYRIFGIDKYSYTGRLGDVIRNVIHPDDLHVVLPSNAKSISEKPIEYRILLPNNIIRHIWAKTGDFLLDEARNPILMSGIAQDVTERKKMEDALRDAYWRVESIIEGTQAGTWEWNIQTGETVFNQQWAQIIGYSLDELAPVSIKIWEKFSHPEDLKRSDELLERHFAGELSNYESESRMKHKDGRWVWVLDRGRVITRTNDGRPLMMFGTHLDITSRKQVELALLASEAKLRTVLKNSHDAIGVYVDGVWTMCNPAVLQLFGVPSEQGLIGTPILNVIAPAERARIREYVRSRTQGNNAPSAYVTRGLRSNGSEFDLEVSLSTFTLQGELNVLVILRDISERKLNEDLLRESEQRFRHLADAVPALVWQSGTDALCDYFNKRWLEFTGRTLDQEMGNGWAEGVHPDDFQKCLDIYLGAFEKREIFSMEYRLRRFDGEYRWLLDRGVPRFTVEGIFLGYLGSCVDIGDIKQLESDLQTQRDFATTIINTMGQGLTVSDADGGLEFVNPAYAHLFGYEPEDLTGKHPRDLTVLEDYKLLDEQREQRLAGKTSTYESHLLRADGSIAPVLITGVPRMPGGSEKFSGSISVITDLTEQKRTENELRTAKEALEQALIREQELSQKDGLTGITNRRYLFELAERKLAIAARYDQSLAVIMFDIDHFKQVNDVFGHDMGDKILKHVVQTARAELRTADVIGRYGGEEFIILLPMTNAQQAYPLAERIRTSVAGTGVPSETGNVSVTLSVGIVEMIYGPQAETVEDLFRRADKAMYGAKFTGRDRTVIGQK